MPKEKEMTGYASIDKPWLKYYAPGTNIAEIPDCSIYQMIKNNNLNRPGKIAIELRNSANNYEKGIEISYKTFFERIEDIAKSYSKMGLKANQIVITLLPNVPESRMLIYGLNILGVTVYPVSFMVSASQLDKIISDCESENIVIFFGFYEKFSTVLSSRKFNSILFVTGLESTPKYIQFLSKINSPAQKVNLSLPGALTWAEFDRLKKGFSGTLHPYYDKNHVAVIVGTSGTTGTPKGVCLTDRNLNAIAIQHRLSGILAEEDVMLDALIQSIGYGISTMHYSTCYGCRNILIPQLLLDKFPEVLCITKPDHFTGGPVHCQYLVKSDEFKNGQLPKMKNLVSGGASLPKSLEKRLNGVDEGFAENGEPSQKIIVRQGFGATENGGCGAYARPGAYKFGGVGIPLPFDTFAVFKPGTDIELPYNEEGELCISGPTVMKEYFKNPTETENVLKVHSDGLTWLHLADLGHMDEDGQVYITDRIKNIFMRVGFNVHPSKIEEYLNSISSVKECAIIGFDHPEQQKVPVAFIVLSESERENGDAVLEMIKQLCYENLEEMHIPYDWILVDSLPRNLGGKVDESQLIEQSGINYMH